MHVLHVIAQLKSIIHYYSLFRPGALQIGQFPIFIIIVYWLRGMGPKHHVAFKLTMAIDFMVCLCNRLMVIFLETIDVFVAAAVV